MLNRLPNNKFSEINQEDPVIFVQLPDTGGLAYCQALNIVYEDNYIYTNSTAMLDETVIFNKKAYAGYFNLGHKFYENIPKKFNHLVILRQPFERFISSYYAVLSDKNHPYHEQFSAVSLEEFCADPNLINLFRNDLLINTLSSMFVKDKPCGATQRAKFNITNFFTLFGLSERFEEFLIMSKCNLGWEDFDYSPFYSVYQPPKIEISKAASNKINEFVRRDNDIYNFAVSLYEERLPSLLPESERKKYFDMKTKFDTKITSSSIFSTISKSFKKLLFWKKS